LFVLLLATSFSGAFWTIDLVREYKREKTRFEREIDSSNREIEKVKSQPQSISANQRGPLQQQGIGLHRGHHHGEETFIPSIL
jgi:hypothetical protein